MSINQMLFFVSPECIKHFILHLHMESFIPCDWRLESTFQKKKSIGKMGFVEEKPSWFLQMSLNTLPKWVTEHGAGNLQRICSSISVEQRGYCEWIVLVDMIKFCSLSYRSVTLMFQQLILCNDEIPTGGKSLNR